MTRCTNRKQNDSSLAPVSLIMLVGMFFLSSNAFAIFITADNPPWLQGITPIDNPWQVQKLFWWHWAVGADNKAYTGRNWDLSIKGNDVLDAQGQPVAGVKTVDLQWTHKIGPHQKGQPRDKDPNKPFSTNIKITKPVNGQTKLSNVFQQKHPTTIEEAPHYDFYGYRIVTPDPLVNADADIEMHAIHSLGQRRTRWSFTNSKDHEIDLYISASYADGTSQSLEKWHPGTVAPGKRAEGDLPKSSLGLPPTDVNVIPVGSFSAATTLAFIGDVDGTVSEIDYGVGIEYFTGGEEFVVPYVESATQDLYVFVDLTQWLSFPYSFNNDEIFDFNDGINSLLPGFLVATAPINFIPGQGLVYDATTLYSGSLKTVGIIDGKIPESDTLTLVGLGIVVIRFLRRRGYAST